MKRLVIGSFESHVEENEGREVHHQRKEDPEDEAAAAESAVKEIGPDINHTQQA